MFTWHDKIRIISSKNNVKTLQITLSQNSRRHIANDYLSNIPTNLNTFPEQQLFYYFKYNTNPNKKIAIKRLSVKLFSYILICEKLIISIFWNSTCLFCSVSYNLYINIPAGGFLSSKEIT